MPAASTPASHGNPSTSSHTPLANVFPSPGAHSTSGSSGGFADHAATTGAFDATTNTHSVLASKVIEKAVGESPSIDQNPALASALDSLKEMLGKINENPNTADLSTTLFNKPVEKAPAPSRAEIYEILRKADSKYGIIRRCLRRCDATLDST